MKHQESSNQKNPKVAWLFVPKIVLTVRKNCSSDPEKLLKFEAEGTTEITRTS